MIQHDNVSLFFKIMYCFRDPLLGLRQFLVAESPLKMMKKEVFKKALFVQKMFKFLLFLTFCSSRKTAW